MHFCLSISPPAQTLSCMLKVTGETSEVKRIDQDWKSHQTLDDIFQKSCSHLCHHQLQNDNLSGFPCLLDVSPLVGFFLVRMITGPTASTQKQLIYHSISRSNKTSRGILLHYTLRPVMSYWRIWKVLRERTMVLISC